MTTPQFKERAAAWALVERAVRGVEEKLDDTVPLCTIDGRCTCPTCGVIEAILKGRLAAMQFSPEDIARVSVVPGDLIGGYPTLAAIHVSTPTGRRQVARVDHVQETLRPDILADVKKALECR